VIEYTFGSISSRLYGTTGGRRSTPFGPDHSPRFIAELRLKTKVSQCSFRHPPQSPRCPRYDTAGVTPKSQRCEAIRDKCRGKFGNHISLRQKRSGHARVLVPELAIPAWAEYGLPERVVGFLVDFAALMTSHGIRGPADREPFPTRTV